jgi:YfiH family protein
VTCNTIQKERDGVIWLEFKALEPFPQLVHGVFLRHGGFSSGPHASLNVGKSVGDDPIVVDRNINAVHQIIGASRFVTGLQSHGAYVHDCNDVKTEIAACDALTTCQKGVALLIKHADCQATIFFDPVQNAIACVHSGWRGSVQNIYANAVQKMQAAFGTRPGDLIVCISPSLGPAHAEFKNYQTELPAAFWEFQVKPTYFDFWSISRSQLEQCGVLSSNIHIAGICTYANPQDYFSYRREKLSGRHATVVALR